MEKPGITIHSILKGGAHHAEAIHSGDPIPFSTAVSAFLFHAKLHSIPWHYRPQRLTVWEADLFSFPLLGRYRAVAGSLSRVPNMPRVGCIPLVSPGFLDQALEIIARPPAQKEFSFCVVQPSRMVRSFDLDRR